jgi:hypothetical protein
LLFESETLQLCRVEPDQLESACRILASTGGLRQRDLPSLDRDGKRAKLYVVLFGCEFKARQRLDRDTGAVRGIADCIG